MKNDPDTTLQAECAWVLTNICSGTTLQVKHILELGGLDALIKLMGTGSQETVSQVIWAIGNIAGDCSQYRDMCLKRGCLDKILATINKFSQNMEIKGNSVWVVSNLVRGKPSPNWKQVSTALPPLVQIISENVLSQDSYLTDALWAISYLTDMNIQESIAAGCILPLISCIASNRPDILTPALRALGNLISGDEYQTDMVLSHSSFLARVFEIVSHEKKVLRKEAYWIISNITASSHIDEVLDNENYVNKIKEAIGDNQLEVANEAAWAITNMFSGATDEQMTKLIRKYDLINSLGIVIDRTKNATKGEALNSLQKILKWATSNSLLDLCKQKFTEAKIPEKIHTISHIADLSVKALEIMNYFEDSENYKVIKPEDVKKIVDGKELNGKTKLDRKSEGETHINDEDDDDGGDEDEEEEEDDENDENSSDCKEESEKHDGLNENESDEVKQAKKSQNTEKED